MSERGAEYPVSRHTAFMYTDLALFTRGKFEAKPPKAPLPVDALPKLVPIQGEEHEPAVDAPEASIEQ